MKKIIVMFLSANCILSLTGCGEFAKDKVLDKYNQAVESVGDMVIHKDNELVGNREMGVNSYVGTYTAEYDNFTGQEILFGGTSVEKGNGTTLKWHAESNSKTGTFTLSFAGGSDPVSVLMDDEGEFEEEIELASGSNYIYMDGENFTGNIQLSISEVND